MPLLFKRSFVLLFLVSICAHGQNMANSLLEKSMEFYKKYEASPSDRLAAFKNDDLSKLSAEDLDFLKSRIKVYGLAPISQKGNSLIVSLGEDEPLEIDYQSIDIGSLVIGGIPYSFNLNQPLKKLYEVDYKKARKNFKKENSSLWQFPFFALSLSGCVPVSGQAAEAATNSSSIPLAYLRLCSECISAATNPTGAAIGAGLALAQGVSAGIKQKSLKACGIEFCRNLPGIGGFMNLYEASKSKNASEPEHSK